MNNYYFKLVEAKREFIWHNHPKTNEVSIVIQGKLIIELKNKTLHLTKGEMVVIPKGTEHKPVCKEECSVLLIEPKDTLNTGNTKENLLTQI